MIVVLEILMLVAVCVLPIILTPKKKKNNVANTPAELSSEYGVDQDGYLVRLEHNKAIL